MKINKKLMTFGILGLFALALVSATTYYAFATITLNINQPISVIGDGPQTVPCGAGETCIGTAIKVNNNAGSEKTISLRETGSGSDVEVNYVGRLELDNKIPCTDANNDKVCDNTDAWERITETPDKIADFYYFITGEELGYRLEAQELDVNTEYSIIYYADPWAGNNPGALIRTATSDSNGVLVVDGRIELNMDLPTSPDENIDANPNYCDIGDANNPEYNPNAEHCYGAKIWLVPSSDYNEATKSLTGWNPTTYLFETDLIYYFDNVSGEYTIGSDSFVEFYPLFTVDKYAPSSTKTITVYVE